MNGTVYFDDGHEEKVLSFEAMSIHSFRFTTESGEYGGRYEFDSIPYLDAAVYTYAKLVFYQIVRNVDQPRPSHILARINKVVVEFKS